MKNQIDPSWISWAKNTVDFLKDGGYMIFPRDAAVFQVNKTAKTVELICCDPSWIGGEVEQTNRQVFSKINYRYVRPDDVATTPGVMIERLFNNLRKYASDIPTLLQGIGVVLPSFAGASI